ncbi:RNA chaperone Hfq [Paenibacillus peoriae]|uniref:RNA chaperone Hfq n=1 Tax=Paenibacillus peoriae TaxID=59893 RepID=UPI0030D183EE
MNKTNTNLHLGQEYQLIKLKEGQLECTVITTNGVQMRGKIKMFDKFCLILLTRNGMQNMIYKHAISTIK